MFLKLDCGFEIELELCDVARVEKSNWKTTMVEGRMKIFRGQRQSPQWLENFILRTDRPVTQLRSRLDFTRANLEIQ